MQNPLVPYLPLKHLFILCLITLLGACATNEHAKVLDKYRYLPVANNMQQVDDVLAKAKSENKLAMIVLGAQWCHDSVGLAEKFSSDSMQTLLDEKYVSVFIDVGYLEDRRNITQRFGYPTYFGTPTVLIVEPNTESLLNHDEVSKWQAADSVPSDEYLRYFGAISGKQKSVSSTKLSPTLNAKIAAFEQQQVTRLYNAYAVLGPMLKADEDGTLADKDDFYAKWKKVYQFRRQLQADLVSLKNLARKKKQEKDKSRLLLPTYPAFEWETK